MYKLETVKLTHVYAKNTPFERVAVDAADFKLAAGEFRGIIGRTGSGKSTFIQHLNGLLKPASGQVLLDGEDISKKNVCFRVGLVFQYPEYQLFEETVRADIAFGPKNMGLSGAEIEERVAEAMNWVGLGEDLAEKSPFELSGGQKRRAAIAGVLAMRPEVLILDEPTAGLDPQGAAAILSRVRAYHRDSGAAVIMVSHNMEEISRLSDNLTVFTDGAIIASGTPQEVFADAERLESVGLSVPEAALVCARLKARGLPIEGTPITVAQAADAVTRGLRELRDKNAE